MIRQFTSAQFVPANAGAKAKNPVGSTLFSTPMEARAAHGPTLEIDAGAEGRSTAAAGAGRYARRTRAPLRRGQEYDFAAHRVTAQVEVPTHQMQELTLDRCIEPTRATPPKNRTENVNRMDRFFNEGAANWAGLQTLPNHAFICGFCSTSVSSNKGFKLGGFADGSGTQFGAVYICPNCGGPVFFHSGIGQKPSPAFGNAVQHVPDTLNVVYEEARRCTAENCHTAAVLLCRKILMHIAVEKSAKVGLNFLEYVNFLSDKGYIPPDGKHWVDHIRRKGNEATHEIVLMSDADARDLIRFVEMLLRFVYEFPKLVPNPSGP